MAKNPWYLIRKKGEKHWTAYQIKEDHMANLQDKYEYCGPFKSLVEALIKQPK